MNISVFIQPLKSNKGSRGVPFRQLAIRKHTDGWRPTHIVQTCTMMHIPTVYWLGESATERLDCVWPMGLQALSLFGASLWITFPWDHFCLQIITRIVLYLHFYTVICSAQSWANVEYSPFLSDSKLIWWTRAFWLLSSKTATCRNLVTKPMGQCG